MEFSFNAARRAGPSASAKTWSLVNFSYDTIMKSLHSFVVKATETIRSTIFFFTCLRR